jgi:hypothetical protein
VPGISRTQIFLRQYSECPPAGKRDKTFQLLAHECVHALQAQELGWFSFQVTYLTCFFARGSREGEGNCLEEEAYAFADGKRQGVGHNEFGLVRKALKPSAPLSACLCGPTGADPFPWMASVTHANPAIDAEIAPLKKSHTTCSASRCDPNLIQRALGWWLALAGVIYPHFGTGTRVGTVAGALIVGISAAVVGALVTAGATGGGLVVSVAAGVGAGLVGLIVGAIVGGIIGGLLGAIVDGIGSLFGGDDQSDSGRINLLFSTDYAHSWANKATFERSRAQPGLAFGPAELAIAWTGLDGKPNTLIAAQDKARKATYDERSSTCGEGLARFGGGYLLAWRGRDPARSPNVALTYGDRSLHRKQTIDVGGPRDSTPSVTSGLGAVFVAAVNPASQMIVRALRALGDGPGELLSQITLDETTDHWGTPAIAYGQGRVYVAWAGTDPEHHLNVVSVDVTQTASGIGFGRRVKHRLPRAGTSGATGPALAWHDTSRILYLAWIDPADAIHVAQSIDAFATVAWESTVWGEISRHNAGPGLAVHADGTVGVAWVGQG